MRQVGHGSWDMPWPAAALDTAALEADSWRPTPIQDFVLKVHQRCNLACDYCYVYTQADQSWRSRPLVMSPMVRKAAVEQIAVHAERHQLCDIDVVLHGGEPLLAGVATLVELVESTRAAMPEATTARVSMQTNGVLLDERALDQLVPAGLRIGVSLDGTSVDNDSHRYHADGRGSSAAAYAALDRLTSSPYRAAFAGLLCVIDPARDPVKTYEALLAFDPPGIDLLLPHANWCTGTGAATFAYGDWLIQVFECWYSAPVQRTRIRLFESVVNLVLGGRSVSEHVGLSPTAVAVVETDGAIEQTDALKTAYEGAASTGLSVLTDTFDDALRHPGIVSRQIGLRALSRICRECRLVSICGGGHFAHRYHTESGFESPSVYCQDLERLILHVQARVDADLSVRAAEQRRRI